jgi:TRAP-type C4-dicarboxylate transport system permease small subunit
LWQNPSDLFTFDQHLPTNMSNLLGLEEERPVDPKYDNVTAGPDPELPARVKRGASWFYWIAGLSVINSVAFAAGGGFHFLAGLGVTEVVDAVVDVFVKQGAPPATRALSIVFDLIAVLGFALCGYFGNKYSRTALTVGIGFYFLDALIVLLLGDLFMVAFHALALYGLIRGYLACREMKIQQRNAAAFAPPPPPAAI